MSNIDLHSLFQKYPECTNDANRFRAFLKDLYPEEKAVTNVLVTIVSSSIGQEIQKGKNDRLALIQFAKRLESEYGFSRSLCEECLKLWAASVIELANKNRSPSKGLDIADGVLKGIGSCTDSDIIIPNGVRCIAQRAFENCSGLTSVNIADTVTTIDHYAFSGCINLLTVIIPDSIISIGIYAFSACMNLRNIRIPDSVKSIGAHAFDSCMAITNIEIPKGVTVLGQFAFCDCRFLEEVTISGGVAKIDWGTFQNCINLLNVSFPESIKSIGIYAFYNCKSLENVIIPNGITQIDGFAFANCMSLTSISIPESAISIGDGAFSYCVSLTSITIPNSIASIGKDAFAGCCLLCNVHDDILYIGNEDNPYLVLLCPIDNDRTSCVVNESTKVISASAFMQCNNLSKIDYDGTIAEWEAIKKIDGWKPVNRNLIVTCTDGKIKKAF